MKKIYLLLLAFFTLGVNAQTKTFNSKVKIKVTPTAVNNDSIVAINTNGEIRKTNISFASLASGIATPTLAQVVTAGNTTTGTLILNHPLGFSNSASVSNGGLQAVFNTGNSLRSTQFTDRRMTFTGTDNSAINSSLQIEFPSSLPLNGSLPIDNVLSVPNVTGTLAVTSDLNAYLPLTGGTLSGQLIVHPNTNVNELLILRGLDAISDIIMIDNSGSGRVRMFNGAYGFFTGGSANSESASGASETVSFSSTSSTFRTPVIINRTISEIEAGSAKGGVTKEWVEDKFGNGIIDIETDDQQTTTINTVQTVFTHTIPANTLQVGDIINIKLVGTDTGGTGTRSFEANLSGNGLNTSNPFFSSSTSSFICNIEVIITASNTYSYSSSVDLNNNTGQNNARRLQTQGKVTSSGGFDITTAEDFTIDLRNTVNGHLKIHSSTIKLTR